MAEYSSGTSMTCQGSKAQITEDRSVSISFQDCKTESLIGVSRDSQNRITLTIILSKLESGIWHFV